MSDKTTVEVQKIELLAPDVLQLMLLPCQNLCLDYQAGQYISILYQGIERCFSLANAPGKHRQLELHIRRLPGNDFTTFVFETLVIGDKFELTGPFGTFTPRISELGPAIFVAGGTGFAPIKSFIEYHLNMKTRRQITLYRGARTQQDLYLNQLCQHWQQLHLIDYVPVLSDAHTDESWQGQKGLIHEALINRQPSLTNHEVYACGPPEMVATLKTTLLHHGLLMERFYSEGG